MVGNAQQEPRAHKIIFSHCQIARIVLHTNCVLLYVAHTHMKKPKWLDTLFQNNVNTHHHHTDSNKYKHIKLNVRRNIEAMQMPFL